MNKKKTAIFVFSILVVIAVVVLCFRLLNGYYPLPSIIYKLYYAIQNDKERLDRIEIDDDFIFYKDGYFVSREISSPYPLPHFLILGFEPDIAPNNIKSSVSVKIELFSKNGLVYSTVTKDSKNLFKPSQKGEPPLGVNAITIFELPFPLKRKAYDDIRIEVTVIEPDPELHKYIDKASLFLFPNIILH